jgi:hypothetical protein
MRWLLFVVFLLFISSSSAQEIHEFMDLQTHPCMHVPYSFFGTGPGDFEEGKEPDLTWKYQSND